MIIQYLMIDTKINDYLLLSNYGDAASMFFVF